MTEPPSTNSTPDKPQPDEAGSDFDAADVAASILGLDEPDPAATPPQPAPAAPPPPHQPVPPVRHGALGWVLLISLIVAVSIAISLAVQLEPETSPRVTPPCGGLYSNCCDDWDDNRGPCPDRCDRDQNDREQDGREQPDTRRGLFDRESDFAEEPYDPRC